MVVRRSSPRSSMRRSEVAAKVAEHRRVVDSLPAVAAALPLADGETALPLRLDLLPSMIQYALSSRTGIEQHVQYLSLERLLLEAFGLEQLMPPERYANLVEFEATLRAQFGEAVVRMLHGQGWAGDSTASGTMDAQANAAAADLSNPVVFLSKRNSGIHSADTIQRALPAADLKGGPQLHSLLNFFEAALARGQAVTFSPPGAPNSHVILCDVGMDGLMLGAGAMVDEHALKVVGLRRSVGWKEARRVLEMDDALLAQWFAGNPALQTAVRPPLSNLLPPASTHPPLPADCHHLWLCLACLHAARVHDLHRRPLDGGPHPGCGATARSYGREVRARELPRGRGDSRGVEGARASRPGGVKRPQDAAETGGH